MEASGVAPERLSVALPVPPDALRRLADLPRRGLDAEWVARDEPHITLRFLGDVMPDRAVEIAAALSRVRRPAFSVEIDGIACFADRSPGILYASVASVRRVTALCADITETLAPLGFDFGARPYVPHITLARLSSRRGVEAWLARHGRTLRLRWSATLFQLLRPPGAIVRSFPLGTGHYV